MKCLIQRVSNASVVVDEKTIAQIQQGILVLVGFTKDDTESKLAYHVDKLLKLRVFPDDAGKMNRSIVDINGSFIVVSQFTLASDCNKGTRPSFDRALAPEFAESLYSQFIALLSQGPCPVQTGSFGAHMDVSLTNDGPVTFLLEN